MTEIKPEWKAALVAALEGPAADSLAWVHGPDDWVGDDGDILEEAGQMTIDGDIYLTPLLEAAAPMIAADARREALEEAAKLASWAHMVPPDGGSPTEDECRVAETAAAGIRALIDKDARAAALDALGALDGETP